MNNIAFSLRSLIIRVDPNAKKQDVVSEWTRLIVAAESLRQLVVEKYGEVGSSKFSRLDENKKTRALQAHDAVKLLLDLGTGLTGNAVVDRSVEDL